MSFTALLSFKKIFVPAMHIFKSQIFFPKIARYALTEQKGIWTRGISTNIFGTYGKRQCSILFASKSSGSSFRNLEKYT